MFVKNNRLIAIKLILTVLTCFLITILIKINFFLSYFINVDSAFYVKWFSDLSSTNQIFPNIKNNFLNNLLIEKGTFSNIISLDMFLPILSGQISSS